MRVGHLQTTRPEWFDRTPTAKLLGQNYIGIGVAAYGTLWTYTVPAGKKAWVASGYAMLGVATSPTAAGYAYVDLYVFDGATQANLARAIVRSTVPGALVALPAPVGWMIPAGVQLSAVFAGTFASGTFDLAAHAFATEFDA